MVPVRVGVIGPHEVRRVGRDLVRAAPLVRQELEHRGEDALVRLVAVVVVHRLVGRLEVGPERVHRMARPAGRFGFRVGADGLAGVEELPGERHPVRRVEGEQLVQDRRARAAGAHHEHGGDDRLVEDRGVGLPPLRQQQPLPERPQQLGAGDDPPGQREVGLGLEGLDQASKCGRQVSPPKSSRPVLRRAAASRPSPSRATSCAAPPAAAAWALRRVSQSGGGAGAHPTDQPLAHLLQLQRRCAARERSARCRRRATVSTTGCPAGSNVGTESTGTTVAVGTGFDRAPT